MAKSISMEGFLAIFSSILIAMILMIIPMPSWMEWIRPLWVLMVLIYWTVALPDKVNLGIGWIAGIIMDILGGTVLGMHALAIILVLYIVDKFYIRFRMFPLTQQSLLIFMFTLLYQFIIFCELALTAELPGLIFWVPSATSMILWPWVFVILRDIRRRFVL